MPEPAGGPPVPEDLRGPIGQTMLWVAALVLAWADEGLVETVGDVIRILREVAAELVTTSPDHPQEVHS